MSYTKRLSLICAICLGTFMATLDISIVNVALPTIQNDINANMATLQWIVDAYALCLSACILSSGPLSDRFGRKKSVALGGDYFHSRLPYLCYCTTT
ncbi:MFS family transporter [Proteus mirabilis]|uniref:MFS family transporter n=1 Tax=Proteus mirabilis TaxID=584 RepID=A0A2X2CSQ6_PROMI|nr:MFS family transporter [Proteus mirabilis]